jgi:2-polyprenyl-3-methyl-5-hydroxy-6-metoxy-1,4-benzoquinol methylase
MRLDALTERIACPLCKSSNFTIVRPSAYPACGAEALAGQLANSYSHAAENKLFDAITRCCDCSLLYLNPRIRHDIILGSYVNATEPTENPLFVRQADARVATFHRNLRYLLRTYGLRPSRDKFVLDIGCSSGAFPKAAHDLGFSAVGVEPNRGAAEMARARYDLDIRAGTLEEQDFRGRKFAMITLWDVIEHLADPVEVARIAREALKDDGLLVINFPNHDSIMRRLMGRKWPMYANVHLTYFTSETITKLLDRTGFEVVEIRPFFQTLELGYLVKRTAALFPALKWLDRLVNASPAARWPTTYNLGQSLLVARKRRDYVPSPIAEPQPAVAAAGSLAA